MIRKLAHTCFTTDDLPRFVEFYTKVLELPIKITFQNKDGEIFGHYFDCGDSSFVEVFDRKLKRKQWGGDDEPLKQGNQASHICFEVTGLKELKQKLESRGVKVTEMHEGMCGGRQAWINDPDGNPIELMEYSASSRQIRLGAHTVQ